MAGWAAAPYQLAVVPRQTLWQAPFLCMLGGVASRGQQLLCLFVLGLTSRLGVLVVCWKFRVVLVPLVAAFLLLAGLGCRASGVVSPFKVGHQRLDPLVDLWRCPAGIQSLGCLALWACRQGLLRRHLATWLWRPDPLSVCWPAGPW